MSRFRNIEEQISAYLDGEMKESEQRAFEQELDADPALLERLEAWAQTDRLVAQLVPAPDQSHLDALVAPNRALRFPLRQLAAMVAVFVFGGLNGYGLSVYQGQHKPQPIVIQAVAGATAAHRLFTTEVRHAVEVPASETEHLETWLSKRMGREMNVPQLDAHGLSFVGGRMLPFLDEVAGQYMYEDAAGERMTLYMAKVGEDSRTSVRYGQEDGLTIARWQDGPWLFVLVAPIAQDAFLPIASDVHEALI